MAQTIPVTIQGQQSSSRTPLGALRLPVRSLYVHVPFCFHKCHYCDFYSFVDSQDRQPAFVDRLIDELSTLARHAATVKGERPGLRTIFVGGGTPSLLRPDLWLRLLGALRERFDLSEIDAGAGEFTVECNPETVTPELMQTLKAGGVDRVSVGAQSFETRHLKTLERWHDPENVAKALALAAEAGIARRNLDLIFAIPGQTLGEWERDLDRAIAMSPGVEHISCYSLTYEPNTAMTKRMMRGDFEPAEESLEVEMHLLTAAKLAAAGLMRYEVSNFARPGAESQHNLAYWRQEQWLAAGPSASGHVFDGENAGAGHRWKNVPRLTDWMEGVAATGGYSPITDYEGPDAKRALSERIMMGLRLAEGLRESSLLSEASALGAAERLRGAAVRAAERGLLTMRDDWWRLTDEGFLHADGVAAEMMSCVSE